MYCKIKISTLINLALGTLLCILPVSSFAGSVMQTKLVSGNIVHLNGDHSVRLNDGNTYYPSRIGLVVQLKEGEDVTLRYFTDSEKKDFFFEYAPGLNSLQETAPNVQENVKNHK